LEASGSAPARNAGVLCLHGLTGTPYEVRSLAEDLSRRGLHCLGPVLPGHDRTPEELAAVKYGEWVECARDALATLRDRFDQVFVVGMSMGGLVSLVLAAEERPDAVVSIGAPLKFHPALHLGIPLVKYVYPFNPKSGGSDIRDDEARARHPGMKSMPLASVHELMRLQRVVKRLLKTITQPILIAHGALDQTANPVDARTILAEVNSGVREFNIYENSGHVVPVDIDRDALAVDVGEFLLAHCRQ
jgi:carboxylesterase